MSPEVWPRYEKRVRPPLLLALVSQPQAGQPFAAAGGFALLAFVGAALAWSISNNNNLAYLDEVKDSVATLRQAVDEAKNADLGNLVALLPLLDHAESLAVSERYTGSPPISWRWGLLQVPKVQTAADTTYLRLLEDAWLPGIVRQLRSSLQQTSTTNPEASYEALKASELESAQHPYTRGLLASLPRIHSLRPRLPVLKREPGWRTTPSVSAA